MTPKCDLQQPRIPSSQSVKSCHSPFFHRTRDSRLRKFPSLFIVKRGERDPPAPPNHGIEEQISKFPKPVGLRIPVDADHQSTETRQVTAKNSECLQRQRIRNVKVVEYQNQRLRPRVFD